MLFISTMVWMWSISHRLIGWWAWFPRLRSTSGKLFWSLWLNQQIRFLDGVLIWYQYWEMGEVGSKAYLKEEGHWKHVPGGDMVASKPSCQPLPQVAFTTSPYHHDHQLPIGAESMDWWLMDGNIWNWAKQKFPLSTLFMPGFLSQWCKTN